MAKKSYHDYVIKDGKFIGQFDEMYADIDDPWMQSTQPNKYARSAAISYINKFNIKSLVEFGGGMGFYADWIYRESGVVPISVDISPKAIEKGKKRFPHLDLRLDTINNLEKYMDVDAVYLPEILWYILDDLESIIANLMKHFYGKYLVIVQVFYKGTQKYGTEFFTSQQELIDYMPFKLMGRMQSTLFDESTIETATVFKIEEK
jgi:trans-aconitate methyltransferase